jgi:hypothetical protein
MRYENALRKCATKMRYENALQNPPEFTALFGSAV